MSRLLQVKRGIGTKVETSIPLIRYTAGCGRRLFSILNLLCLLAALISLRSALTRAQEKAPSEYQLKSAFIYHFAKFVEWPPEAFAAPTSPFIIGIIGDNPFGDLLPQAVQKKDINGHPFAVKEFKTLSELRGCHILFISQSERKRVGEILRAVRGEAVLTVSELEQFLTAGGMIQLIMEDNKVRFAISNSSAKQAGLRISSKLLNLAKRPERGVGR